MIYDDPSFPKDLKQEIYEHLKTDLSSEHKEGETEEQFIYKSRKRALGPFKEKIWGLPPEVRAQIASRLEAKFSFLFEKLRVVNTRHMVKDEIISCPPHQGLPQDLSQIAVDFSQPKEKDLADHGEGE